MKKYALILAIIFLISVLYLPLTAPLRFNTPDETANFFFSKLFAQTGTLKIAEPLSRLVDNAIHPRGINVIAGFLVPESFLGLPLIFGALGRVFGSGSIVYLTAIITFLVLPLLYYIFKKFFDGRTAKLACLLILINPVFWYNISRGLYHNLLFLDLLIVFLFLMCQAKLFKTSKVSSVAVHALSGLILGLALLVRPAEALWVIVLAGVLFIYRLFKKDWPVFGLLAAAIPLFLMFYFNNDLYGGFFRFGYAVTENTVAAVQQDQSVVPQFSKLNLLNQLFLPFGFHPLAVARRFFNYGIQPVWWYILPGALGVLYLTVNYFRRVVKPRWGYLSFWLLISVYLILYYGSFNAEFFTDPGQEISDGIGSAYLRYWLPIYVFAAPLAALGFRILFNFVENKKNVLWGIASITSTIFVFLSVRAVFWRGPESMLSIRSNLRSFDQASELILSGTPVESILLLPKWADRLYFPKRRVIVDVEGKNVVKIINTLLSQKTPVFYLAGRGAIPLKAEELAGGGLIMRRRFDLEPQGKFYEMIKKEENF